ncbi:MAG: hypothetical protein AAF799_29910 [Myxococcota bacterium]
MLLPLACGPAAGTESGGSDSAAETQADGSTGSTAPEPTTDTTTGIDPDGTAETSTPTGPSETGTVIPDFPDSCNTIEQNCPPGYKCMPYSSDGGSAWNDTMCVPIARDPAGPGEPCTAKGGGLSGIDDCDGTSMCWNVDQETNMGSCIEFCTGDFKNPGCPDPCDTCQITGDGVLNICTAGCDPLVQDCPQDQACYPTFSDSFTCVPDGSRPETMVGAPCEFINACPAGLACINGELVPGCEGSSGCCTALCPVDGPDPCPALLPGSTCDPFWPEGVPDKTCVGAEPGLCVAN